MRIDKLPQKARKPAVLISGSVFVIAGAAMVVLPGPAFVFLPLGFLVLATEFQWAQQLFEKLQATARRAKSKWRARRAEKARA